ncbi:MAG: hypothetical protein CTY34_10505 [Methylobacter sp.]|nr:MAG: hypothetical protein CTY34_10505 [Methylobacter sp.]PPD02832.1 MAG: hypothetical protein CTY29_11710 [Methylobacter sp.]PPD17536.1 MAG: hypothetical protein CTY24_14720 [Methylobacter sp.]
MGLAKHYLETGNRSVSTIVKAVDKDVERGENIVILGYSSVLMAPIFAPVLPPYILLPLMAIVFGVCACSAHKHFQHIRRKLKHSLALMAEANVGLLLKPLTDVCASYPSQTLTESFNPLKNLKRTFNSLVGGLLINPLWMPVFYMMGMHLNEEKSFISLNQAVMAVEKKIFPKHQD